MNATTLYNIKISKSGVKLKTISTGLMAEISVYDLDDRQTYLVYCYKELAEKVSRMKLQPREFIIASGKMEYIPMGDNFLKVLKATSVEYCKASAKPDVVTVESSDTPVAPAPTQVAKPVQPPVKPVQAEPKNSSNNEINLDEDDIFADMLVSADEL